MQKRGSLWFWILIVLIFVLYCLAWRRPFCQTLENAYPRTQMVEAAEIVSAK